MKKHKVMVGNNHLRVNNKETVILTSSNKKIFEDPLEISPWKYSSAQVNLNSF